MGTEDLLLLHAYWAKLERTLGNDLAAARGVWENTLKKRFSFLSCANSYIVVMRSTHCHLILFYIPVVLFWKSGSTTLQWR